MSAGGRQYCIKTLDLLIKHLVFCGACKIASYLEDKLLHSETCHKEALQKIEDLESALQNAHRELKVTLTRLQELQDALQNAESSLEEKRVAIMDLTSELR